VPCGVAQERIYGTDRRTEVADTVYRLAGAWGLLGHAREATQELERLLQIQRALAGGQASDEVVSTMKDIARGHGYQGQHQEKIRWLDDVLQIQMRLYGIEDHREASHKRCCPRPRRPLGPSPESENSPFPQVIKTVLLKASAQAASGDLPALLDTIDRAIGLHKKRCDGGLGDPLVKGPLLHLRARALGIAGRVEEKQAILEELLAVHERENKGVPRLDTVDAMLELAEALALRGDQARARGMTNQAFEMCSSLPNMPAIMWADAHLKVAAVYAALGDLPGERDVLEQALRIQKDFLGTDANEQVSQPLPCPGQHPLLGPHAAAWGIPCLQVARTMLELAAVTDKAGDQTHAVEVFRGAQKILQVGPH
jgi:tetratricopeptide (TPR) repeat protein